MRVFTRQKYGHKAVWLSSVIQMVALYDFAVSTETSFGVDVKVIIIPSLISLCIYTLLKNMFACVHTICSKRINSSP